MKYTETHYCKAQGNVLESTINWLKWVKTHIHQITASQPKVTLSPRGHLTVAGNILGCPSLGHGCYWHLAGRNQRSCHIFILQHTHRGAPKGTEEMATHSSILAWRIPWTKEPGRLQSMRSQRIGYDCVTTTSLYFRTQNCPVTTLPRLRNPGPRHCPDSLTSLTQSSHGGLWEQQKRGS